MQATTSRIAGRDTTGFNKENLTEVKAESTHSSGLTGDALIAFNSLKKILSAKEKAASTARVSQKQSVDGCNSASELLAMAVEYAQKILPAEMKAVKALADHLKKIEKTGKTASAQIQALNQKIAALTNQSAATLEQSTAIDTEKKRFETELKTTTAEAAKLQAENIQLKDERRDHGSQLAIAMAAAETAKAEVATLKVDIRERDGLLKDQDLKHKAFSKETNELEALKRAEILELNRKLAAASSAREESELENRSLKQTIERYKKMLADNSARNGEEKKLDESFNTSRVNRSQSVDSGNQSFRMNESFINTTQTLAPVQQPGNYFEINMRLIFGKSAWVNTLEKFTALLTPSIKDRPNLILIEKFFFTYLMKLVDEILLQSVTKDSKQPVSASKVIENILENESEFKKLAVLVKPTEFKNCDPEVIISEKRNKAYFYKHIHAAYKNGFLPDNSKKLKTLLENAMSRLPVASRPDVQKQKQELLQLTTSAASKLSLT